MKCTSILLILASLAFNAACTSEATPGPEEPPASPPPLPTPPQPGGYSVTLNTQGLQGAGLEIGFIYDQYSPGASLPDTPPGTIPDVAWTESVTTDGSQVVVIEVAPGGSLSAEVLSQPADPDQTCDLTNNAYASVSSDVTVNIFCDDYFDVQYRIEGVATGADPGALRATVTLDGASTDYDLVFENGVHSLPDRVQPLSEVAFSLVSPPGSPRHECEIVGENPAPVFGPGVAVTVNCKAFYPVNYEVTGLQGDRVRFAVEADGNARTVTVGRGDAATGSVRNFEVAEGSLLHATVTEHPDNPEQVCHRPGGSKVVRGEETLRIECTGGHIVEYTVEGVTGSGLSVAFEAVRSSQAELDLSNGTHRVPGLVAHDSRLFIAMDVQPVSPDQYCRIENGGARTVTADINDIRLVCEDLYAINYSVTGHIGNDGRLEAHVVGDYIVNGTPTGATAQLDFQDNLAATADGRVTAGSNVEVRIGAQPTQPERQHCLVQNGVHENVLADIEGINVYCSPSYPIIYEVRGLEGVSGGLSISMSPPPEAAALGATPDQFIHTETGSGQFTTARGVPKDWTFTATFEAFDFSGDYTCEIENGGPRVMGEQAISDIVVTCENGLIGGEVEGMMGTGLLLNLLTSTSGDPNDLQVIETLEISVNGSFHFTSELVPGSPYTVEIAAQPSDPNQECELENESGTVTVEPMPDVLVLCPGVRRAWAFHNYVTRDSVSANPPLGDPLIPVVEQIGGVVSDSYDYDVDLSVKLGTVSGLDITELFMLNLDENPTQGLVYSSPEGSTYWLAIDSGSLSSMGDSTSIVNGDTDNQVYLDTYWLMRKENSATDFSLLVTQARALGFLDLAAIDGLRAGNQRKLVGDVTYSFHVQALDVDEWVDVHTVGGQVFVLGALVRREDGFGQSSMHPEWTHYTVIDAAMQQPLWADGNFTRNDNIGVGDFGSREQVSLLQMLTAAPVQLDLSAISTGQMFRVKAHTRVRAVNALSSEGGIAVFTRDPVQFDPGQDPLRAGMHVTAMEGVRILNPEDDPAPDSGSGQPPAVGSCPPGAQPSVLEFAAADYELFEAPISNLEGSLEVIRDSEEGPAGASVVLRPGASSPASIQDDVGQSSIAVVFGAGGGLSRSVNAGIIDDTLEEEDETLTATLENPTGCALIGAQSSATVTIRANDPSAGFLSLATDTIDVDESTGVAAVEVLRSGGIAGALSGTVSTAGGTATPGDDFISTSESFIFQPDDDEPKIVHIPIIDDGLSEADETIAVTLTVNQSDAAAPPTELTVTIRDNDSQSGARFQFDAASYSVDETGGTATVEVLRVDDVRGEASVDVFTQPDTAAAGTDYTALNVNLTFADGESGPKPVDITIVDDTDFEGDERFSVALSNPVNASLGLPDSTVVTIADDETVGVPPPIPVLAVAPGVGELEFTWSGDAAASYYRLTTSADGLSPYVQVGGDIPAGQVSLTLPMAVHLTNWTAALYRLQACNSAGCTDSNDVSIVDAMLGAIGFFKASNTEGRPQQSEGDSFGFAIDVSADGSTLAVGAPDEDSDAILIGGDQTDNDARNSGAVYVFHRGSGGWTQQAYIKAPFDGPFPQNGNLFDAFGFSLSLSGNGNRLVVGAPNESGIAEGIDGAYDKGGAFDGTARGQSGAAYVYERSGNAWTFATYIKASNTGANDKFGHAVAISDDGDVIVVGAPFEDNGATGIEPSDQADDSAADSGAAYVFENDGLSWSQSAYVKASNSEAADRFGHAVAISGDGSRFAATSAGEDSSATGVDGDQSDNSAAGTGSQFTGTGAVYAFVREPNGWVQEAYVKPSNTGADDVFGDSLAMNGDGSKLAVGAPREDSAGSGVGSTLEQDDSAPDSGAAYLYSRDSGTWLQEAYLKASNSRRANQYGSAVALSGDGDLLAIGAPIENSNSVGVNGSEVQLVSATDFRIGAVYMYRRDVGTGGWQQVSYVKASNSDQSDEADGRTLMFGDVVALSADGAELVVAGHEDGSEATGIGGDNSNENQRGSGAVYLY